MIKRFLLLLFHIWVLLFLCSCSQRTYYQRLYSGHIKLSRVEKKTFKKNKITTSYYVLQEIAYNSDKYQVILLNDDLYSILNENHQVINNKDFIKKMVKLKLRKQALKVNKQVHEILSKKRIICSENVHDIELSAKEIIKKYYDAHGFLKGDLVRKGFSCLELKILESEKVFIEDYHADVRLSYFKDLE